MLRPVSSCFVILHPAAALKSFLIRSLCKELWSVIAWGKANWTCLYLSVSLCLIILLSFLISLSLSFFLTTLTYLDGLSALCKLLYCERALSKESNRSSGEFAISCRSPQVSKRLAALKSMLLWHMSFPLNQGGKKWPIMIVVISSISCIARKMPRDLIKEERVEWFRRATIFIPDLLKSFILRKLRVGEVINYQPSIYHPFTLHSHWNWPWKGHSKPHSLTHWWSKSPECPCGRHRSPRTWLRGIAVTNGYQGLVNVLIEHHPILGDIIFRYLKVMFKIPK